MVVLIPQEHNLDCPYPGHRYRLSFLSHPIAVESNRNRKLGTYAVLEPDSNRYRHGYSFQLHLEFCRGWQGNTLTG